MDEQCEVTCNVSRKKHYDALQFNLHSNVPALLLTLTF